MSKPYIPAWPTSLPGEKSGDFEWKPLRRPRFRVKWKPLQPQKVLIGVRLFLDKCLKECEPGSVERQAYTDGINSAWQATYDLWEQERLAKLATQTEKMAA